MFIKKKRLPIRKKVQQMMLLIALSSLVLTSAGGIISMAIIQRDSEAALTRQMEENLHDIVVSKGHLVDSELGKFAACARTLANFLHDIYLNPPVSGGREILPPRAENANRNTMQRSLSSREVSVGDVWDEMLLLSGTERMWDPVMLENQGVITTIYLATENGLMLSYDAQSQLAVPEAGDSETYYNFFNSMWYRRVKGTNTHCFTEIYQDVYGRGLTITCAAPFYDAENKFAGVVAMDILISDMYHAFLKLDMGNDAHSFLVDRRGYIIAPSTIDDQENNRNLYYYYYEQNDTGDPNGIIARILTGKTGVSLSPGGIYYAYTPIASTKWKFCISVDEKNILAPVRSVKRNVIMMMLLFLAAGIWLIVLITKGSRKLSERLTGPIDALRMDVEKISEGNLEYRAKIYDDDEIGDLAEGFNNMAASLKNYVQNMFAVTAEAERIRAEMDIATQIQSDLLPRNFPPFPDHQEFEIYATMTPAKEVGGDFYDYFLIDEDHLALVIADVAGKGVPAALFMAIAKTLIKNRTQMGGTPPEILTDINNQLCEESSSEVFVTVWLGILELSTGKITSTNAGHEYPVLKRAGGAYRLMKLGTNPAVATLEGLRFHEDRFALRPGDSLFLYTDGVTDAICPTPEGALPQEANEEPDDLFGVKRMIDALNRHGAEPVEELLVSMKNEIDAFAGNEPQFDDITMLALQYYGEGGKPLKEEPQNELEEEPVGESGEITVEARTEMLEKVHFFIDKYLDAWECPPRAQMQIDVAVEEIFVNITSYAYTPKGGMVMINVELLDGTPQDGQGKMISLTFTDGGVPYNPLSKPDPDVTLSAGERPIGGLGIYMVKRSMDNLFYEYKDGKNILRMTKRFEEKGE
ncbi:MAG: SpoIIE family protein phosphatase [Fretibacterium sp.]|nr:SpoIIE family protein phosphatase [Fretibacterium sp.]